MWAARGVESAARWATCRRKKEGSAGPSAGRSWAHMFAVAERVGFEPTRRLPAYGISSAAH